MGEFDDFLSLFRQDVSCEGCGTRMEADDVYHPTIAAYVSAWVCPECNRQVVREPVEADAPEVHDVDGERWG